MGKANTLVKRTVFKINSTAVKRLEQILILRKLTISIKDIQRIFNTSGSEVVLDVLGKKVENIDDEVALLHELKEVVLEFIRQIEQADFSKGSDVKMLYERAKEIEGQLINVTCSGNPSNVSRLLDVTEKMKRAPEVRIIQINPFKAFSSGLDTIDNVWVIFSNGRRSIVIWSKNSCMAHLIFFGLR
jgi:hypothetical protein